MGDQQADLACWSGAAVADLQLADLYYSGLASGGYRQSMIILTVRTHGQQPLKTDIYRARAHGRAIVVLAYHNLHIFNSQHSKINYLHIRPIYLYT